MVTSPGRGTADAVALIGVGCRLPGGICDLDGLWRALVCGDHLVGEVPPDRFEALRWVDEEKPQRDRSYTGAGGFLRKDLTGFDAAYFRISPKEAAAMDPQQRLLLEMAAEALDDAGIDPASLAGSDTAVFVGISDTSYGAQQMLEPQGISPYTMIGGTLSIAANRLSHAFDLHGPSMAVDTACSSSLLAVERACRTLLDGTSRVALAGGVNVLLSPFGFVGFSQAAMLSPSGRCAAFSAGADGFVRAEGGGVVVLKRLADALADGDRIHGVILAAGTNNDGRTNGLAMPNAAVQEALLRQVYERAGIDPDELVYVEAHGTGTQVGDRAECLALGRALAGRRTGRALPIGSVKSNLGHLEPASGMAGLFKALLVLKHGVLPASLHAEELNPEIDFDGLGLSVVTRQRPLLDVGERPVVGINSFGFGGSNVHVAITAAPATPEPEAVVPTGPLPLIVSAKTRQALHQMVDAFADHLDTLQEEDFYDVAYTASRRRGLHPHRAAVLAASPEDAARALRRLSAEGAVTEPAPGDARLASEAADEGQPAPAALAEAVEHGSVAFVFSGNGSQWAGMGADLLAEDAVFRSAVEAVDAALTPWLGWSVLAEMASPPERWRLTATEVAQPMLFAVQAGLVAMLARAGVRPAAVLGHSVGEVAAAYAAGALSLEQAAQVIAERGGVQAATRGRGRMAAVGLSEAQAVEALAAYPGLEVAAVNSDRDVTVAGPDDQLKQLGTDLEAEKVFFRHLDLDYPFHSSAMDAVRVPLLRALDGLRPRQARIPMISTVTGRPLSGPELTADYWWRNVREPVRFAAAVEHALSEGLDVLVEIGPHPVLRSYLRQISAQARRSGTARHPAAVVPTVRRDEPGPMAMGIAVATIIASGARLEWQRYFPRPGQVRELPRYAWQRDRHWIGDGHSWQRTSGSGELDHPLLGERMPSPQPSWHGRIERPLVPWLPDHRIGGSCVMPVTGYVEMALSAGRLALAETDGPLEVDRAMVTRALTRPEDPDAPPVYLQTTLSPETGVLIVSSTQTGGHPPQEHFRARVRPLLRRRPLSLDVTALRARITDPIDVAEFYRQTAESGLEYGPAFRVLTELRGGAGESLGRYSCPAQADGTCHVHPVVLDSALQVGVVWLVEALRTGNGVLPSAIGSVRVWRAPAPEGWLHIRERGSGQDEVRWDITITDLDGQVAVEVEDCRMSRLATHVITPLKRFQAELRAQPHEDVPGTPWPLGGSERVGRETSERIAELRDAWARLGYGRYADRFEEVFAHGLAQSLAELAPTAVDEVAVDDLVRHGVDERRIPMVRRALPLLQRHGLAEHLDGDRFRLDASRVAAERLRRELCVEGMPFAAEQALAVLASEQLGPILTGQRDPVEVLAASGGADLLNQVFDIAPLSLLANRIARAYVEEIVRDWPVDRPLRILEVGAGVGGTAAMLLPVLPADRAHYVFTDVADTALARARRRFAAFDFIDYRLFDLDADPLEQGYWPGSFDLVVAGHALHLARDLPAALRRLSELLVPGGRLLAVEPHRPPVVAFADMLEGYWDIADERLRDGSPLLAADRWPALLAESGLRVIAQTGDCDTPQHGDVSVLLACTAGGQAHGRAQMSEEPALDPGQVWVIVGDGEADDLTAVLSSLVNARGGRAVTADPERWRTQIPADAASVSVVFVLGGDADLTPEGTVAAIERRIAILRTIAGGYGQLPAGTFAGLWLITRPCGALPEPGPADGRTYPQDAAVWGASRTLGNEQPELTTRRVCLHRGGDVREDAERLLAELVRPGDEDEIVLTREGRFVARMREVDDRVASVRPARAGACHLTVRDPGTAYRLSWQPLDPVPPGPGEVLIETRAVGLNYRDVVRAVNLLPAAAFDSDDDEHPLGLENAGVVSAVGPGVSELRVGDRVLAVGHVGIATHATIQQSLVWRIPDHLSFTEAATLPLAYITVVYGLGNCARLRAGETLLVHGGAGGVGLAAIAYARRLRARVIATAGSPVKRDFLRTMGVEHVLDSRSLDFAEEVRELTGGRGVDVVLNSLAGEALHRSLESLAPGGRFVELGKRDIYENKPVLLRSFGDNISFFGVDMGSLIRKAPERAAEVAAEAFELMNAVPLSLPHTIYPAARVDDAVTLMRQSRHIGKIVITFDQLDEPIAVEPAPRSPELDPQGSYLITGGLSGFGAATARWLATCGARHLALVGRRGADSPEAAGLLRELDERGVSARVYAADAADETAMRRIVAELDAGGRPLRGVVHSAMHLDDDVLANLSDERIRVVLRPKVAGALALDAAVGDRDLDMFVMYSSISATLGHVGQASYVAGNLFLEALAHRRRAAGHRSLAVCLGVIGETGVLARNKRGEVLARLGVGPIRPAEAFAAMEDMLADNITVGGVARYDWSRLGQFSYMLNRPRMSQVLPAWLEHDGAGARSLAQDLAAMDDDQAIAHINTQLAHLLSTILYLPADQISPDRRLEDYGMDSLMNAQIHASIRRQYGIEISPLELMGQGGTVSDITRILLKRLRRSASARPVSE